jgi:hypothetical protein
LGEKFVDKFLKLIGLELEESVRGSRERLSPRPQINVVIHKAFRRECLRQFGRKDLSGGSITKEDIAMHFLFP